ncbi:uncharacterized protein LOC132543738 [Ylistrum balloti]|uniref:uncharacterized protein LOC132543738 n=1 Tax=Ylistrum balloti TaxID=509963 RepID=UPI002905A531|nr:uncharacterized protein LOC132543738 [Ylistrum balloti]
MKVGVAVACCAMKPKNMSVRTFTEGLCSAFHNANQQLQHKHASMEAEILHLRQQLALSSTSSRENCRTQNSSQVDDDMLFPTPPLSNTDTNNVTLMEKSDIDSLHSNTQFLQSVINIQQVTRQGSQGGNLSGEVEEKDHSALTVKLKSLTNLYHTTVVKSLQTIRKCIQDQTVTVSTKSLLHCTQCILQMMDHLPALACNTAVSSLIKDIVKCLVDFILDIKEDSSKRQRNSRHLCRSLVLEFSKPPITRITLEVLVEEIQKFSQHLQGVCNSNKSMQVSWFENIIFVIQLLHIVLGEEHSSLVTKDHAMLQELKDKLEESLLHVTHPFPLYAHAIWNVCGQLELEIRKTSV